MRLGLTRAQSAITEYGQDYFARILFSPRIND